MIQNKELREKLKPIAWGYWSNTLDDASHVVIIVAKKNARYDSDSCCRRSRSAIFPKTRCRWRWTGTKKFQVHV